MSVLQYFKNTPRSPPIGRQAQSIIFFLQIRNEVPGERKKKGACRPPNGRQGPVAHPWGDRGLSPVGGGDRPPCQAAICRHSLCHLSLKIQKKREG